MVPLYDLHMLEVHMYSMIVRSTNFVLFIQTVLIDVVISPWLIGLDGIYLNRLSMEN
jgi:hypothetical protein